ncbi:hypothetical protein EGW08_013346, partial [Elysia chlorotica]
PKTMAFYNADIVPTIWSRSTVHHHSHKVIQSLRIKGITKNTYCIKKAKLKRKDNSMRDFNVAIEMLHILEPLQVECKNLRQFFHTHSEKQNKNSNFLFAATDLAVVLVFSAQCLCAAEHTEAMCYRRILKHINTQIKEIFIFTAY